MVNKIKSELILRYKDRHEITSIAFIQGERPSSPLIDGFDVLVLVVTTLPCASHNAIHYIKDGYHIQERRIDTQGLERSLIEGRERNMTQWIMRAECIFDREGYFEHLQQQIHSCPDHIKERKLFLEFSSFLRYYLQSKEDLASGNELDAYSNILTALRHWARIEVIKQARWPETMVWNQVRKINAEVYKLYEELTTSQETLRKRVELIQLACEFSMLTKMEDNCALLIRILSRRKQHWSISELQAELKDERIQSELALVLKKMLKRGLIFSIPKNVSENGVTLQEIRYGLLWK